ncbi:MAG: adenylate/guanylate cyclase domain-containing protein [Variovorax sp.]|nr:adenylate/guanylate cyclase domain-containing protein [Variovorax sp.]
MTQPKVQYARVGDDRVAYQVLGDGPLDLVATAGIWGHIDLEWEDPATARFLRRLASFSRLIRFDPRGVGLSDARPSSERDVSECWAEDLLAVMTAVGSQSIALVAWLSGQGPLQFAAKQPQRVRALVLVNMAARYADAADYPQGHPLKHRASYVEFARKYWGTERWAIAHCPSLTHDEQARHWHAKWQRAMAGPKAIAESFARDWELDARPILASVRAPTLVMARSHCLWLPPALPRYLADHIPGARLVEFPGADILPFWETPDPILDQIEEFITGQRHGDEGERALLTVLFTDIVASTTLAARMGNAKWLELLNRHDQIMGSALARFGGKLVERTGDGTLATFDRPGRAIDCAVSLHEAMASLNIKLRAGLHTAEVELRDDGRIGGIGVHVSARVMANADAGEVWVSHTVESLLLGSHYGFIERGSYALAGVPGNWTLFAVQPV